MAAVHWGQFFAAGDLVGATEDDDWRCPLAPVDVCSGVFRIHYATPFTSFSGRRYLLSVETPGGHLGFFLQDVEGFAVMVELDGQVKVARSITYPNARQQIAFVFDAVVGSISITGSDASDGTTVGESWSCAPGEMRIGGCVEGSSQMARGWVSLPYAVLGQSSQFSPQFMTWNGFPVTWNGFYVQGW